MTREHWHHITIEADERTRRLKDKWEDDEGREYATIHIPIVYQDAFREVGELLDQVEQLDVDELLELGVEQNSPYHSFPASGFIRGADDQIVCDAVVIGVAPDDRRSSVAKVIYSPRQVVSDLWGNLHFTLPSGKKRVNRL